MTGFNDEEGPHTHGRKPSAVTPHSQQASRQEPRTGRPPEVSADVTHTSHLSRTITNHRSNMAKWKVSNSVAIPPHVTEQEVFALATILSRNSRSKF